MLARIIVAGVGIVFLLGLLFRTGGAGFWLFALCIGGVGVLEMNAALRSKGETVEPIWPLLGALLLISAGAPFEGKRYLVPALVLLFLGSLTWTALRQPHRPFERVSRGLLLAIYPGLLAVPVALRYQDSAVSLSSQYRVEAGAMWVLIAFLLVWVTDSAAYFAGRAWGRRKLSPKLSPSKTWEGSIGGWVCASLLGLGLGFWMQDTFHNPFSGLLLGMLAGIWAQVGDLVESAMKRELGVKDFGGWLPGHGGVLDRFDSFLFVCPLVYLWSQLK